MTLTELAEERYLTPVREWAKRHGRGSDRRLTGPARDSFQQSRRRSYRKARLASWRGFSTTRWASSASHLLRAAPSLLQKPGPGAFAGLSGHPLDMKAEADLHFPGKASIRFVGHGWPYSPPERRAGLAILCRGGV